MAKKKGKPYHHGDLRAALLAAAKQELEEAGTRGFSLRSVAVRAGVSNAAPYRHFPSREALLVELLIEGTRLFTAALRTADSGPFPEGSRSFDRLLAQCVAYLEFSRREGALLELLFSALGFRVVRESEGLRARIAAGAFAVEDYDSFGVLSRRVEACIAEGSIAGDDPQMAAMVLWAGVHGLSVLEREGVIAGMAADVGIGAPEALRGILAAHRLLIERDPQ